MPDSTKLIGVTDVGNSLLSDQLEANIIGFFDYALLEAGGFFNVTIPTTGVYGGSQHQLRAVTEDPYYQPGQVWEGFRQNWVWETGLEYPQQPIHVSGVYVNGSFYPTATTTGTYQHTVNYPLGRVVFTNNAVSPSSTVTCEYSYRLYNIQTADANWWRELQRDSFRVDDSTFLQHGSGNWADLGENRIQLPAVVVDVLNVTDRIPFEMGTNVNTVRQDVIYHIVAETNWDRRQIHDILTYQKDKRLIGFDVNAMKANEAFPLDSNGMPVSGAKNYSQLILPTGQGGYMWKQLRCIKTRSGNHSNIRNLFTSEIRATWECEIP